MARPSGLGRGLSSLIPTAVADQSESVFRLLPISSIRPNPYQPRKYFEEESLIALADSIAALGVLQPVLVRRGGEGSFELIAGERRWRAAKRAGLDSIPALVQEADDVSALEQAVVENLHRSDLNPLEEAAAYQQLIEDFGLTHDNLSKRVGKSRAAVTNTLRILQLPSSVQRLVATGELSAGHARTILGLPDRQRQEKLAELVVKKGMSVREVEELVREERDGPSERPPVAAQAREKVLDSSRQQKSAGVLELEELLGNYLNTSVLVEMSRAAGRGEQGGKVTVSFGSLEDLERIFRLMFKSQG